jgi:hypothetical protein
MKKRLTFVHCPTGDIFHVHEDLNAFEIHVDTLRKIAAHDHGYNPEECIVTFDAQWADECSWFEIASISL